MRVDQFDFELPEALIALRPAQPREAARLLHVPPMGEFEDRHVADLPALLRAGDLLVLNDTRVIAARLIGVRQRAESRVRVEANLLRRLDASRWSALAKPGKRLAPGDMIAFGEESEGVCMLSSLNARIESKGEGGEIVLAFDLAGAALDEAIAAHGGAPLPPYILSKRNSDEADRADYQTIFAREDGSVAAPTAGLHFTPALFEQLKAKGIETAYVTLHVGAGTFLPVKADDTDDHKMHSEWRDVSADSAEQINDARAEGRRVIAVGTTALRTLESSADAAGFLHPGAGDTDIFITPVTSSARSMAS